MRLIDTLCIEIVGRCPLACVHCSANASPQRRDRIGLAEFRDCLSKIGRVSEIYLSGGEPFEHPDLVEMIQDASRHGSRIIAYSSGTRLTNHGVSSIPMDTLVEARRAGLIRIDVSIYADQAEVHDAITTVSGSFDATLETARRIADAGLLLGVHFVPIGAAANHFLEVVHLARSLGAERLHCLALARQGRAARGFPSLEPSPGFSEALAQLRLNGSPSLVLSSTLRHTLEHFEDTPRDKWRTFFIDVRGFVYPGEGWVRPAYRSSSSLFRSPAASPLLEEVNAKRSNSLAK